MSEFSPALELQKICTPKKSSLEILREVQAHPESEKLMLFLIKEVEDEMRGGHA